MANGPKGPKPNLSGIETEGWGGGSLLRARAGKVLRQWRYLFLRNGCHGIIAILFLKGENGAPLKTWQRVEYAAQGVGRSRKLGFTPWG